MWPIDFWHWLALCQHELLLFAGVFFLIGALDDVLVDGGVPLAKGARQAAHRAA